MKRSLVLGLAVVSLGAASAFAGSDRSHRWFDRLDTNQDGVISQAEVSERQAERFAKLDTDGDGAISLEEYSVRSEAMFAKADADGNGEITKDEFADAKAQWRKKHKGDDD
ncbi:MAG: EF-hand domain-containing protein [Kiloniellales bacterium]|jgi:Ca2+-binding EF-hand superfamily protein|nr:EF-hand domain-containing protein [Kiloniellales bacterium]